MRRGVMLIVTPLEGGPSRFVPVDSIEEAQEVLQIIERLGFKDVNGTPVTVEIAEYEESPL